MQNAIPSYYLQQLNVNRRKGCNDADAVVRCIFDRYVGVNEKLFHIAHWNKMEAGNFIKDLCCFLDLADCLDQPRKRFLSRMICAGMEFCLTNKSKARWFHYFLASVMRVYIDQEQDGSVISACFVCWIIAVI